jgi:hypothetical protein
MKTNFGLSEVVSDVLKSKNNIWAGTFTQSEKKGIVHPKIIIHGGLKFLLIKKYGTQRFTSWSEDNKVFFKPSYTNAGSQIINLENEWNVCRLIQSNSNGGNVWPRIGYGKLRKGEFNITPKAFSFDLSRLVSMNSPEPVQGVKFTKKKIDECINYLHAADKAGHLVVKTSLHYK